MMISDLPHDLESEILYRVPAKSLAKWKTTCKRWYALFRDPRFVKKNFASISKGLTTELIQLWRLQNNDRYALGYGSSTSCHSYKILRSCIYYNDQNLMDAEFEIYDFSTNSWRDLGYITRDDLVYFDFKTERFGRLPLPYQSFNAEDTAALSVVGDEKLVVLHQSILAFSDEMRIWVTNKIDEAKDLSWRERLPLNSGLCKSSYHSHKILRYCFYYNDQNVCVGEFEIYDFSSDSWRVLDDCTHNWGLFCNGMSLKGNTYFVAGEQETGFFMLYFDFKTERFERLPLPYQSFDSEETAVLSVVREEKLAVLQQNIQALSNEMRIWVTNKIDEAKDLTWSNFVLTVDYDRFSLPSVNNVSSFLLDEENKVALCCDRDMDDEDKTRVYIVGETTYKEVYKETIKGSHFNWPLLLSYLPSLVHIHENTPKRQKKGKQEEIHCSAFSHVHILERVSSQQLSASVLKGLTLSI
ncbi:unnamed protein product [Arabidopsis lyrata]|nr:unnamed protein product [Arabidopsis lyrata]